MHVLTVSPLGEPLLDSFVDRAAGHCASGEGAAILLLLPSSYLLNHARRKIQSIDLPGFEPPGIFSLDEFAEVISSKSGMKRTKISQRAQELLLFELTAQMSADGEMKYFSVLIDRPGFVKALTHLIRELKRAHVKPEEFLMAVQVLGDEYEAANQLKDADVAAIYKKYQDCLAEQDLADIEEFYFLAIEQLERGESSFFAWRQVFLSEFAVFSPLQLALLKAIKPFAHIEINLTYERNRVELFEAMNHSYEDLLGMGFELCYANRPKTATPSLQHICKWLFHDKPVLSDSVTGVEILRLPGRSISWEIIGDRVKQMLLADECPPEQIAIVSRDKDCEEQLRVVLSERDIAVDIEGKRSLGDTALGMMVARFIEAAESSGSKGPWLSLLKSPYIKRRFSIDGHQVEYDVLKVVIKAINDWPVNQPWSESFQELRQWMEDWSATQNWLEQIDVLRRFLLALDLPACIAAYLDNGMFPAGMEKHEQQAMKLLFEVLSELEADAELVAINEAPLTDKRKFNEMLSQALRETNMETAERKGSGVQFVTPDTASGRQYHTVFLADLTDGVFPKSQKENWLYSEAERRRLSELGVALPLPGATLKREDLAFATAIAMPTSRLILCAISDKESLPSPYVHEIIRLFESGKLSEIQYALTAEFAGCPEESYSAAKALRNSVGKREDVLNHFLGNRKTEQLLKSIEIEESRPERWNGKVSTEYVPMIKAFSSSALEKYGICPFAYYVSEILKLEPMEEAEEGLDAVVSGMLWHMVLAGLMAENKNKRLSAAQESLYIRQCMAFLDQAAEELRQKSQFYPDVWWRFERQRMETEFRRWLQAEIRRQNEEDYLPEHIEWFFGGEKPLRIELDGQSFSLQGKVDRVDKINGDYAVIDYKTGILPRVRDVREGKALQIPLYIKAVSELLCGPGEKVSSGRYEAVKSGKAVKVPGAKDSLDDILSLALQRAASYVESIRTGNFAPDPTGKCPDYCELRVMCRYRPTYSEEETEAVESD